MNTEPQFCPECECMAPRRYEERMETHVVGRLFIRGSTKPGITVTVPATVAVCTACGRDLCVPELDDATLARVYAAAGLEVAP